MLPSPYVRIKEPPIGPESTDDWMVCFCTLAFRVTLPCDVMASMVPVKRVSTYRISSVVAGRSSVVAVIV